MLYAQRSTLPAPDRAVVNGEWRYEPTWPPERLRAEPWSLADATANRPGDGPDELDVRGDVGRTAWISCAGVLPWGQPDDQRPDELHSLTYTWAPFEREFEILGHARVRVRIASSEPVAYLSAKLCDVFPDGTSSLVARNMLNLTHRDSREQPSPMPVGELVDVELEIEAASWTFEPGHRPAARPRRHRLAEHMGAAAPGDAHDRPGRDDARAPRDRRPEPDRGAPGAAAASRQRPGRGRRRRRRPGGRRSLVGHPRRAPAHHVGERRQHVRGGAPSTTCR